MMIKEDQKRMTSQSSSKHNNINSEIHEEWRWDEVRFEWQTVSVGGFMYKIKAY